MKRFVFLSIRMLLLVVFRLFFLLEVQGRKRMPGRGSFIIAANHVSFLDPPLIGCISSRELRFFSNAEVLKQPVIGPIIKLLGGIPVYKKELMSATLRKGLRALQAGQSIVIFPEGTRSRRGEHIAAKPGLGFLHTKSGAPIIPIFIKGTEKAWPVESKFMKPFKLRVYIGEPLTFKEMGYHEIGDRVLEIIKSMG